MSRTENILLIVLLALSIVFVGGAEQETVLEQTTMASTVATPASASPQLSGGSISNYTGTRLTQSEATNRQTIPNPLITRLLFENGQRLCWIRASENGPQTYSIARAAYITPLNIIISYKSAQQEGQTEPGIPVLFSKSLQSGSPPGLIQRL